MGWLLCDHPLVAVNAVQEGTRCVWLVLAVSRPAWIRFRTVTMCSVGQAEAGGSHTSLEVDGTRTPWVRELGWSVLWFHTMIVYSEVYTHLWYKSYCVTIYF